MHQYPEPPTSRRGRPIFAGPAVEDHGRVLTANILAAALYRRAQQAVDSAHAVSALRSAVESDRDFGLAIADLDALTGAPPSPISGRQMNWERHHIEVVRTASVGNLSRAADLLREYLASVGCDPLALRIVTDLQRRTGHRGGLEDLIDHLPECHRAHSWS